MDLSARPRTVLLMGSTGSIGVQALDVVRRNPDRFRVAGLAAGGADPQALAAQVLQTGAPAVAVARGRAAQDLQLAIFAEAQRCRYNQGGYRMPRILVGPDAVAELVATQPADVVLNGVTGSRGLGPTLAALESGASLALANKESLVAGGPLVTSAAAPGQIVPVDSEHSALAQCLRGGRDHEVARLVLTASGGPFRGRRRAGQAGGCLPAVFNAANEEAVAAFVAGGLGFLDITGVVEDTLAAAGDWAADPATAADVVAAEEWARAHARESVAAAAG